MATIDDTHRPRFVNSRLPQQQQQQLDPHPASRSRIKEKFLSQRNSYSTASRKRFSSSAALSRHPSAAVRSASALPAPFTPFDAKSRWQPQQNQRQTKSCTALKDVTSKVVNRVVDEDDRLRRTKASVDVRIEDDETFGRQFSVTSKKSSHSEGDQLNHKTGTASIDASNKDSNPSMNMIKSSNISSGVVTSEKFNYHNHISKRELSLKNSRPLSWTGNHNAITGSRLKESLTRNLSSNLTEIPSENLAGNLAQKSERNCKENKVKTSGENSTWGSNFTGNLNANSAAPEISGGKFAVEGIPGAAGAASAASAASAAEFPRRTVPRLGIKSLKISRGYNNYSNINSINRNPETGSNNLNQDNNNNKTAIVEKWLSAGDLTIDVLGVEPVTKGAKSTRFGGDSFSCDDLTSPRPISSTLSVSPAPPPYSACLKSLVEKSERPGHVIALSSVGDHTKSVPLQEVAFWNAPSKSSSSPRSSECRSSTTESSPVEEEDDQPLRRRHRPPSISNPLRSLFRTPKRRSLTLKSVSSPNLVVEGVSVRRRDSRSPAKKLLKPSTSSLSLAAPESPTSVALKEAPSPIRRQLASLRGRGSFDVEAASSSTTTSTNAGSSTPVKGKSPFPVAWAKRGLDLVVPRSLKDGFARASRNRRPQNPRRIGAVLGVDAEGRRRVRLDKPLDGPFGFYVAKGNALHGGGVFVSRLALDVYAADFFGGVLGVGDEIVGIDGVVVTPDWTLDDAVAAMAGKATLTLETLPYVCRRDELL